MTAVTLFSTPRAIPVHAADGAHAELLWHPVAPAHCGVLWLPAMGVAARHYSALAAQCADRGLACAVHEWRGLGSSNRRAGRRHDWGYADLLRDIAASFEAARAQAPGLRWVVGGHSLGGQLAVLFAAQGARDVEGLVLLGSGTPYWRNFPRHWRVPLRMAFTLAPVLAAAWGRYPGRRLGFGGNEATGVIRDWARSARSGRYQPTGFPDAETALATVRQPILVLHARADRLAPQAAVDHLLGKMPEAPCVEVLLGAGATGHFGWMAEPAPVAAALARWAEDAFASGRAGGSPA